jgi:AraC-like DNA-binding protein
MNAALGTPRGVLLPSPASGQFQHERRLPSAPLAHLVEHFWYVRWDLRGQPPRQQATLPHPNFHLVVEQGEANIYGVQTGRFERCLEGRDFVFGIKFKAGAFQPFLGAPASTLANRVVPSSTVFSSPGLDLVPRVSSGASVDDMADAAQSFLLAHLPAPDPNVIRASTLVAAIAGDPGIPSVDRLASIAAIDKRALQRLFQKYVGIGPKWVIQRYRLHEAIARMHHHPRIDWAALAQELGYFDQAHFSRDFRALVGQAPGEYARPQSNPGTG